jgi:hypothetical protein
MVGDNNILTLKPNQPFKTKREALKALAAHLSVFNKYLDSKKMYKDLFIFSCFFSFLLINNILYNSKKKKKQ